MGLLDNGQWQDAITFFLMSWDAEPHATTAFRISEILRHLDRKEESHTWIETAYRLSYRHNQIATAYASSLLDRGLANEAIRILNDVLERTPTYGPARKLLDSIKPDGR